MLSSERRYAECLMKLICNGRGGLIVVDVMSVGRLATHS